MPAFTSAPTAAGGELNPANLTLTVGYEGLSRLLAGRSARALQADRCRKPGSLPPACVIPGVKSPVWIVADVLAWLAAHREPTVPAPAPAKRHVGRPTRREQLERAAAARAAADAEGGAK